MNDNNDQQASNQVLPLDSQTQGLRQGLVRSSSVSSSSSFDSCSDLLGSLENAEENPDDLLKLPHTDCKENCAVKDDVTSHQTSSQSENVLGSTAFEQGKNTTKKQVISSELHSEVNNEGVKMELTSVKDHVYGLSTFSKLRSIAENTVERISQLQTSFRLPTSYIFPLKNMLQTDNMPLPTYSDVGMEVSEVCKEHSIGKEPNLGEAVEDKLNTERNASIETSTLLLMDLGDVAHMPHKDINGKNSDSDDVCTEGSSIQEKPGVVEHVINMTNKEKKVESEFAGNSFNARNVTDAIGYTKGDVQTVNVSAGNSVVVENNVLTEEVSSNTVLANCEGAATAVACSKSQFLEHSMTIPETSKHSDLTRFQYPSKQGSGEDSGLKHLEMPTMPSDFFKKSSAVCHPLRTLSSGSGRPDLEEVDDEQIIALVTKQSLGWDTSIAETGNTEGGMLPKGPPSDLFDIAPISNDSLSNVDSQVRVNKKTYMLKGIDGDHEAYIPRVHQSSSCGELVQSVGSGAWSCTNQGGELTWSYQPTLADTVERLNSDCRQNLSLEELSFGDILHEERWKGLSIRLENKPDCDERQQKENLGPDELCRYVETLELNEMYVDTVLDMEDVLLNCDENGSRERFWLASSSSVIGTPRSSRDGSLSSSTTSGLHLFTLGEPTPFTVDWVEVVGAKQRRGGSSFGERIVGVKDHTVYCIKVSSGNQEWEVLRRYRDFVDLYHQLRRKFNVRTEKSLPSPWKEVDRDSRKVFGSTHPNVVEVRSSRIEKCLQSLLQAGPPFSTSSPLCWFLCPQSRVSCRENHHLTSAAGLQKGQDVQLGSIESPYLQSPRSEIGSHKGELNHDKSPMSLGRTVKLNLKILPNKNLKQLLSSQHHSCAGCYKHLEADRGLVHGFVQTLGWGKPRLCEYSGQLYCASCHLNETAVLPAQVLWHWDFTPRRVSQLSKAYLDSIYDQPMLCVSAVNPYLYSRVPILSHVKETRRKLSKMLACMLCPFRSRLLQTMASRRYLLENNDFFALRDLEDLSKGAFAVLPSLLKAVLENLRLHITKQCTICSETGEWCGAGVLCEEPFSPIFPFEEENITSCKACHVQFHKACFSRFSSCPACTEDQSRKSGLVGASEHLQAEELAENYRDVTLLLGGPNVSASPSLAGADLHGGFELDKQSHTPKNWPSFYSLLPKKRLW